MLRLRVFLATGLALALAAPLPGQLAELQSVREFRTIDGTDNNTANPTWGSAGIEFLRVTTSDYGDGVGTPAGAHRPSPRAISNAVCAQSTLVPNSRGVTDFVWQWGQFLDHDIDETPVFDPAEHFDIPVPAGDPYFDPFGTGTQVIPLERSFYTLTTGQREQHNEITAYIDASNVYGSDEARARELRTLDGSGKLKTSAGDLLPFNTAQFPNAPTAFDPSFFLAGDFRANEQVALTAMHTLFVREHNYWAERIATELASGASASPLKKTRDSRRRRPGGGGRGGGGGGGGGAALTGDQIYEMARAIVAAEMQAITYREFLPVLLGDRAIRRYEGYDPQVNASIANVFATASYRFGHSMLSPQLLRVDAGGQTIAAGDLALRDAFFNPTEVINEGIDPILRGLAAQEAQEIDPYLIDDVRNFLFGPPGAGGFDLASLNMQRGRDHGLPSYNQVRIDHGLPPARNWGDISRDSTIRNNLASVYASVDDVDIWLGGLAEDHRRGALVGETLQTVLANQFEALRDGDRFYYEHYLPRELVDLVNQQTLATIIRRNTGIGGELPNDVFRGR